MQVKNFMVIRNWREENIKKIAILSHDTQTSCWLLNSTNMKPQRLMNEENNWKIINGCNGALVYHRSLARVGKP